jgi:hypothetical protein
VVDGSAAQDNRDGERKRVREKKPAKKMARRR